MSLGKTGQRFQGFLELRNPFIHPSLLAKNEADVVVGGRIAGVMCQSLLELNQRLALLPF
jgi:hypothetical protein